MTRSTTNPLTLDAAARSALDELTERLRKHQDTAREYRLDPLTGTLIVRAAPLAALLAAVERGSEDTALLTELSGYAVALRDHVALAYDGATTRAVIVQRLQAWADAARAHPPTKETDYAECDPE